MKRHLIEHSLSTRDHAGIGFTVPKNQQLRATSCRGIYTVRCKELKNIFDIYQAIGDIYKSLMIKIPQDVIDPSFPETYKSFCDNFQIFISTIESKINESKITEEYTSKHTQLAIMLQAGEVSDSLSKVLNVSKEFTVNGISNMVKMINTSFSNLFGIIHTINDAIKKERIVNKDIINEGVSLYTTAVKAYKMVKNVYDGNFKENLKKFDANQLKSYLATSNSMSMHILAKRIPTALAGNQRVSQYRADFSANCGYIGSLMEACTIFYDSTKKIRSNIINLARSINTILNEINIPYTIELITKEPSKTEVAPEKISVQPKPHVAFV